jgi:hypothetical protein
VASLRGSLRGWKRASGWQDAGGGKENWDQAGSRLERDTACRQQARRKRKEGSHWSAWRKDIDLSLESALPDVSPGAPLSAAVLLLFPPTEAWLDANAAAGLVLLSSAACVPLLLVPAAFAASCTRFASAASSRSAASIAATGFCRYAFDVPATLSPARTPCRPGAALLLLLLLLLRSLSLLLADAAPDTTLSDTLLAVELNLAELFVDPVARGFAITPAAVTAGRAHGRCGFGVAAG